MGEPPPATGRDMRTLCCGWGPPPSIMDESKKSASEAGRTRLGGGFGTMYWAMYWSTLTSPISACLSCAGTNKEVKGVERETR